MKKIYYRVADRPMSQIEAFKNRYELVSVEEIKKVFIDLGYEVENIRKCESWGTAHLIYYVKVKGVDEELVFRGNSGEKGGFEKPEIIMLGEKLITDLVAGKGVKTNKILQVGISREKYNFDFQIEEKIIGVDPERYIDENGNFLGGKEAHDKMYFELGEAIAKFSDLKFKGFGLLDESEILKGNIVGTNETFYEYITTNLELHLQFLLENQVITQEEFKKIIELFESNKDLINDCESSLVHHDLAPHNFTFDVEKKGLGVIFDWEAMVLGDPMLDLGSCPTWETHLPVKEILVKGYKSIKDLPRNYELKMDLYELRTRIWKIKFLIQMDFGEESAEEQIEGMKKILKKFS